ncbi:MAG: chorismate synthase, partial [Myxococcales bacterium]|nr:chorismate synthase [Myxococcales bacterium]
KVLAVEGIDVIAYVVQVGQLTARVEPERVTLEQVEQLPDGRPNAVRCPDPQVALQMVELIQALRKDRDSIGGVAEVVARGVPAGLGEPVFDKLRADLGKAILSLPAVMGVEFGSGFRAAAMRGSEHNDPFSQRDGRIVTTTNHHGGMLGGISSGMPIVLRAALKPTSSIPRPQETVNRSGESTTIVVGGRHDPCLLPRFVPMAEAMVALTLVDHLLRDRARRGGPRPSAPPTGPS